LVASNAARWDRLAQVAASLAQHAAVESGIPRFVAIARDFSPGSEAELTRLPLGQRALVCLDCSNEERTWASLKRLREHLGLKEPIYEPPECPYPGLDPFTATNSHLLFGRDGARDAILHRIRECHTRILLIGPSGSGKSSLIHAAVLPALRAKGAVVQVVGRGADLTTALRTSIDTLEVTGVGAALDDYLLAARGGSHTQIEHARARLANVTTPDARRRIVVIDPLEEVFAGDDATLRETLFHLLSGLWSLQWCTVILCMRADFYGR
jgi:hypothetical protein